MNRRIRVKKDEVNPQSTEVLAEAIVQVGKGLAALRKSGLNEKAIVVLLHYKTKVSMGDIRTILGGLRQLEGWYCR